METAKTKSIVQKNIIDKSDLTKNLVSVYMQLKRFLWGQSNRSKILQIVDFEKNLWNNLKDIEEHLVINDIEYFKAYAKGINYVPYIRQSDILPSPTASYRKVSATSVKEDMAVKEEDLLIKSFSEMPIQAEMILGLWMNLVGKKNDRLLGDEVYGGRCKDDLIHSFKKAFSKWNRDVCNACTKRLESSKRLLVIVAELREEFVMRDLQVLNEDVLRPSNGSNLDNLISTISTEILKLWSIKYGKDDIVAIPRGSIIEGPLTNLLLRKFDSLVKQEMQPAYYSRCGCSVALIFEDTNITCGEETTGRGADDLWDMFSSCCDKCFSEGGSIIKEKSSLIELESSSGKHYIESILDNIVEEGRMWQALPESPVSTQLCRQMHIPFEKATNEKNLHYASNSRLRRKLLAKQIHNMEQYYSCLKCDDWKDQRNEFLKTIEKTFCDQRSFISYYNLFPRILAIAFGSIKHLDSDEFMVAKSIFNKSINNLDLLKNILGGKYESIKTGFVNLVGERLLSSATSAEMLVMIWKDIYNQELSLQNLKLDDIKKIYKEDIVSMDLAQLSFSELAMSSYFGEALDRSINITMFPNEQGCNINQSKNEFYREIWSKVKIRFAKTCKLINGEGFPMAFFFATRPIDVTDYYIYCDIPYRVCDRKYAHLRDKLPKEHNIDVLPHWEKVRDSAVVNVQLTKFSWPVKVGLVSWLVEDGSWKAMLSDSLDPYYCDRFTRFMKIINQVIDMPDDERPHYLILPELAIPAKWFVFAAKKLARKRVSLISGVDYIKIAPRTFKNQVWCALTTDIFYNRNLPVIIKCTKSMPAQKEELDAFCLSGAKMSPGRKNPFVIKHGKATGENVYFSVLICSDLLNIDNKAKLRGKVDLLVVPAWNKDTKTYESLVNAAAYDIHAFVALCNSRKYGDSKVRSPAKEDYERDIIKLKGGESDFLVVGKLKIEDLRSFQSSNKSPDHTFKPVPTSFEIEECRRTLPML